MRGARLTGAGAGAALLLAVAAPSSGAEPALAREVYAAHNDLVVLEASSGKRLAQVALGEVINALAFSPDGARGYLGTSGGREPGGATGGLRVLDTASRRVISRPTSDPVKALRLSADGRRLHLLEWKARSEVQAGKKRPAKDPFHLRTFDLSGPEPRSIGSVQVGMDLHDLAVSPDGKTAYLLDPGHNGLRVLDLETRLFVEVVDLAWGNRREGTYREAALSRLAVSPEGNRAAVLQNGPASTGVLLVDLDARGRRPVLLPQASRLRDGAFLPGGSRFAALSMERLLLIDLEAGTLLQAVPLQDTFTSLAVSPSGEELYLGAPVALRAPAAERGGLVEVRDGMSLAFLARVTVPITVRVLEAAPARKKTEE